MGTDQILSYFSIGVTVFMAVVLLFGFFLGLLRGWKKSTLRFGIFVGVSVILLLCMPVILNVTTSEIIINGQTLTEYVASLVEQGMPATGELMVGAISASTAIALAALSSIVYLVLFIVVQFITWIIFGICKLFLRKNKNAPKHRFVGGLIGIVQALFVCFVFMIPVAGFTDVMAKVGTTVEAVVTEMYEKDTGGTETSSIVLVDGTINSDDINQDTNQDVVEQDSLQTALNNIKPLKGFKDAYRKSMPGFIYGVGDLDLKTFDYMSVATVDGVKYKFSDEVNTMLSFVDEVVKEFDVAKLLSFNNTEELKAYLKEEVVIKPAEGAEPAVTTTNLDKLVSLMLDKLFNSNLIKSVSVESVNALAQSTEETINALPEADRVALGFGSTISINRLSVSDVNWETEKEKLSDILSDTIFTLFDVVDSQKAEGGETAQATTGISSLPLEKLGAVLDKFKTLDLFKELFNPGLKRLLCVEKLVEDKPVNDNSGEPAPDAEPTPAVKITIAEYVKKMTKESIGGEGFNLKNLGDYSKINFEQLFGTVKTTLEVTEKMSENGGKLGIGDLSAVLNGLNDLTPELKAELNTTLHAVIDEKLGEQQIGDQKIKDLIPADLNIIECAPIIGSVMDVATAVGSISDETVTVNAETIDTLVTSINNISGSYADLTPENKTAIDNLVANAVNAVLPEGAEDFVSEGIVENLAKDADIVECLLTTNFTEDKVDGATIATAVKGSGLVADLLVKNNATEVFEVSTEEEQAVKDALGADYDKYASLFKFVAPTPAPTPAN